MPLTNQMCCEQTLRAIVMYLIGDDSEIMKFIKKQSILLKIVGVMINEIFY